MEIEQVFPACPGGSRDLGFYGSGSTSRNILVRSGRETSRGYGTNTATLGKGFPPYRTGLYTLSYLFALNVFSDGHPAEA